VRHERLKLVAAVLAVPLAIVLLALAVDTLLWQRALERADVRFEASPRAAGDRWDVDGLLPQSLATNGLQVEDDLAYRRAAQLYVRVEPGRVVIFGPQLEAQLGEAQLLLGRVSRSDANPQRKANALNLLGVFQMSRNVVDADERIAVLRQAIGLFQNAVRVDPSNKDAKLNLELALRDAGAVILPGTVPSGTRAEGSRSGAGRTGSGY
jgi:hypothetical protein